LGYEIRVETLRPEAITGECEGCDSPRAMGFVTIYTRNKEKRTPPVRCPK
jgi:hypothetical protein